jgi:hypothetical protein
VIDFQKYVESKKCDCEKPWKIRTFRTNFPNKTAILY